LLADLPIRMRPVTIAARRRRYRCRDCGSTFLDQLPGVHPRHEATERLVSYVQTQALHLTGTFTALAATLGVSEWLIRDIFVAHVETLERDYVIQTPRHLGIDEIYVEDAVYCVLTDLERHAVVDLLPKRDMVSVKAWLSRLENPSCVEAVAMDLWNPYRLSIHEMLPHAVIVADKYHVLRMVNEVVESVRKSFRASLPPSQQKQLKQDRKILLKRAKDLTEQQRLILEAWTGTYPLLRDLYTLKEEFYGIYDAKDEQEGWDRYIAWQEHVPKTLYDAFLALQLTVEEWGQEIFAHFTHPITNAFTERMNLSIREATRITFGLNYRTRRAKLLFCPSNGAALHASQQRVQPQETPVQEQESMRFSTANRNFQQSVIVPVQPNFSKDPNQEGDHDGKSPESLHAGIQRGSRAAGPNVRQADCPGGSRIGHL
jgi:transposase